MIKISVDESVAYDMLSILYLKQQHQSDITNIQNYQRLFSELQDFVGILKHNLILDSIEYKQMIEINRGVFERLVRLNREGPWEGDALEIDRFNYKRHPLKRALQEKFFSNSSLTEQKTY